MATSQSNETAQAGLGALRMAEPNRWLMSLNVGYEDMLRSAVDWIWECNAQFTMNYVSSPWGGTPRVPTPMSVGRSLLELETLEERDAEQPSIADVLQARQAFRGTRISIEAGGGDSARFGLTGVPYYDRRNGLFLGYRGTGQEIVKIESRRRARGEPDEQLLDLLENALARKDQLEWELSKAGHKTFETRLAGIAHELRTPLNAIVGFAELIKTRALGNDLERYIDYGGDIYESGAHMVALVNNLLELAKIDSQKDPLQGEERLAIPVEIATAFRMLEDQASDAGVKLVNHVDPDLPMLRGERRALRQIFLNLLSNGIKYTRPGGAVGVEAEVTEDGAISIDVWDTGLGIADEEHERIFERNYRVKGQVNADKPGSGLGLAISRDLVRAMGGDITVRSKPGQGARFTVTLPLERNTGEH